MNTCYMFMLMVVLQVFNVLANRAKFEIHCNTPAWANNSACTQYETTDIMRAVKFIEDPPTSLCINMEFAQGIGVCTDNLPAENCNILTVATTNTCEELGELTFEKHWSRRLPGCKVTVLHYTLARSCPGDQWRGKKVLNVDQGVTIHRVEMWRFRCFSCFYSDVNEVARSRVHVLKIQELDYREDAGLNPGATKSEGGYRYRQQPFDGLQYTVLADLFNHKQAILAASGEDLGRGNGQLQAGAVGLIDQLIFRTSLTKLTMIDYPGRISSHASNMVAAMRLLLNYGVFHMEAMDVPQKLWPVQLEHFTARVGIDYRRTRVVSFIRLSDPEQVRQNEAQWAQWRPVSIETLAQLSPPPRYLDDLLRPVSLPPYCSFPTQPVVRAAEQAKLRAWIATQLNARCHPSLNALPCDYSFRYEGFIPCPSQLMLDLAADYAVTKGWCDLQGPSAAITPLDQIPAEVVTRFNALPFVAESSNAGSTPPMVKFRFPRVSASQPGQRAESFEKPLVRLAFFVLIHNDPLQVERLLTRLYSRRHYYMLHIDPGNEDAAFVARINEFMKNKPNIYISRDLPIIYPASSATICLVRAMAWYLKHIEHWDYFVTLTGSDYPLVPLSRMEYILSYQDPPMPFLMAWDAGVTDDTWRIGTSNSNYREDPDLVAGVVANIKDRGGTMGINVMPMRTFNYGTATQCHGGRGWYRLDPRRSDYDIRYNDTGRGELGSDTQFLFTKDRFKRGGQATILRTKASPSGFDRKLHMSSNDRVFRRWTKSDPMFTGAYDRESVRYIVESNEGKRYFQYFSRFLMGSEEHYFSSLFYNWPRTSSFVTSLAAQTQWNTWRLGIYLPVTDGFKMHTHQLARENIVFLRGMSKRGVFFARKFSTQYTADLQNMIDEQMLGIDCRPGHDTYCRPPAENIVNSSLPYNITRDAGRYWPGFLPGLKAPGGNGLFRKSHVPTGESIFPARESYYTSHQ